MVPEGDSTTGLAPGGGSAKSCIEWIAQMDMRNRYRRETVRETDRCASFRWWRKPEYPEETTALRFGN